MADNFFNIRKGLGLKGLASDPSNPADGDIYFNTTSNVYKIYRDGAWSEITDLSTAQTLTNKSISGDQINSGTLPDARIQASGVTQHEGSITHDNLSGAGTNTHSQIDSHISASSAHGVTGDIVGTTQGQTLTGKTFDDEFTVKQQTSPGTPSATYNKLYFKSDDKLYSKNSSGVEQEIGSGGGSGTGEINYVTNPDAEVNTSDWTTFNSTFTRTTTSGEILRGDASFKVSTLSSNPIAYVETDLVIPEADENKLLKVSFDFKYISDDVSDVDVVIVNPSSTAIMTEALPVAGQGLVEHTFASAEAGTYKLRFFTTSTTASFVIDNVIVGPGRTVSGAVVGQTTEEASSWTGASSNPTKGTTAEDLLKWHRVGEYMEIQLDYRQTAGGSAGSGRYYLTVPDGLSIDTSAYGDGTSFTNYARVGEFSTQSSTDGANNGIVAIDTATRFVFYTHSGTALANSTYDFFTESDGRFTCKIRVKIAEWAGSGTLNIGQNDVEYYATDGTWDANDSSTVRGVQGASIPGALTAVRVKTITLASPYQETDRLTLEVYGDGRWAPVSQNTETDDYHKQNATTYGAGISVNGSFGDTSVAVLFAQYSRSSGSIFGGAGDAWGTQATRWRLVRHKSGQAVGFGLATEDAPGLSTLPNGEVVVHSGNGFGSSSTTIRRFSSTPVNTGTSITYADSATDGASFTINEDGIYAMTYTDRSSSSTSFGVSNGLTTPITSAIGAVAHPNKLTIGNNQAGNFGEVSCVRRLSSGDVIRPHVALAGTFLNSNTNVMFTITQIAKL